MQFSKSLLILSVFALLLPIVAGATYPAKVARTGQTMCYDDNGTVISCTGTGQDGAIQAGAVWPDPRFSDRGDGTISDNLTGLVWAQNANLLGTVDADNDTDGTAEDGMVSWQHALDYMVKLNREAYLGYTDWRLPNINELESLLNAQLINPALPQGHPFTNVQSDYYWSSTSGANYTQGAWLVHMFFGYVGTYDKTINHLYVWPVRAGQCGSLGNSVICLPKTGQTLCYKDNGTETDCSGTGQDGDIQAGVAWPSLRFEDNSDGTVTDSLTGLEWTKNAYLAGATMTWQQALDYVKTLTTGSHSDWRLPNERELRSLTDYSKSFPALPSAHPFTNVQSDDLYWSSTAFAYNTWCTWSVDMRHGYVDICCKPGFYNVWPVRAGQVGNPLISTTTTTMGSTTTAPVTTTVPVTTTTTQPTTTTTAATGPCPAQKVLGADNPKLENFRDFRDSKLAQSAVGRKVIHIYYNNADSINAALERSPALRAATRRVLETIAPMVGKN
ncbi:MAG: DUF1566 domain-containing protein [Deltaproteobacteria bacterium]|nr:DUF1566 domain-containing protein [Deltaproteobacteria bacterium]